MRITNKDLEAVCNRINVVTGSPLESYKIVDGRHVSQVGNYHLSGAYGGYALHRMANEGGGITDIFHGHYPKKELYYRMHAFLSGMSAQKELQEVK